MSNLAQTRSGVQAGNPPGSPGVTHSEVVANLFRGVSSGAGIPSAPASALPGGVPDAAPSAGLPAGGDLQAPPVPYSSDLESSETANAATAGVPVSFEPFGSEVLKSLHEFGLGGASAHAPALPAPFEAPPAPNYYFLPQP
ncbi:MAG: hypothetical protein WCS65_14845 [Verrucomicrobiae bacterium]